MSENKNNEMDMVDKDPPIKEPGGMNTNLVEPGDMNINLVEPSGSALAEDHSPRCESPTVTSKAHYHHKHSKVRPIVCILGGPSSGKATQCDRISADVALVHLSPGGLLREEVIRKGASIGGPDCSSRSNGTNDDLLPCGIHKHPRQGECFSQAHLVKELHLCEELMREPGKLVPAEVVVEVVKAAMEVGKASASARGWVVDGFPRTLQQAEMFHKKVRVPRLVIFLDCPKDVMEKRSLLKSGQTSDDKRSAFLKRFDTFRKHSLPVVKFYEKMHPGLLLKVSSVLPPDEVYKEIHSAISIFGGEIVEDVPICPACPNLKESCACPCEECCGECEGPCQEWLCHKFAG